MLKQTTLLLTLCGLTACGSLAIMDKSDAVSSQPEMMIKTDGDLWGYGADGQFTLGANYEGKYSRDASTSTWFNTIETKEGQMVAEVTNRNSGKSWQLTCTGGGTAVKFNVLEFGGNDPYQCEISSGGQAVGTFSLERKSELINLSTEDKETGYIAIGEQRFTVETVHTGSGLLMPLENPLGYSFTNNGLEVAAVQTNGVLTVQWLPSMTAEKQDVLAVGAIASALSWRPAE